jgi:hypothetical protein
MLATLPSLPTLPRSRRTSTTDVRQLLLELTYVMHATKVVKRPRRVSRRRPSYVPTAPR